MTRRTWEGKEMSPFDYHRPKKLDEAIPLLDRAQPLAGGTSLTPRRRELSAVVDLRELSLDGFRVDDSRLTFGAALRLQAIVETGEDVPGVLREACRREASWNLRNMATLGGTVVVADGRSPLLTVLLALEAKVNLEPGGEAVDLDLLLEDREAKLSGRLITDLHLVRPDPLLYEQVARSPADRPLVCVAVARLAKGGDEEDFRVTLGGFGGRPVRVLEAEEALQGSGDAEAAAKAARGRYLKAGDEWASAAYRSEVAGVLTRRLAMEVMG